MLPSSLSRSLVEEGEVEKNVSDGVDPNAPTEHDGSHLIGTTVELFDDDDDEVKLFLSINIKSEVGETGGCSELEFAYQLRLSNFVKAEKRKSNCCWLLLLLLFSPEIDKMD